MKIVVLGAGNVATHMSLALKEAGHSIIKVYSRTKVNAEELASRIGCLSTNNIKELPVDADVYLFSIKDDVLSDIAHQVSKIVTNLDSVFIHTAGSVPLDIFENCSRRYAVLYPMQTFSKKREIDFHKVPCFIESSDEVSLECVSNLARSITNTYKYASSYERTRMHLAAVFACNFTNHCYRLAEQIVEKEGFDFSLFLPLIEETAHKVSIMSAREAQTGPMVRNDKSVMDYQLGLITNERTRMLYRLMAESIYEDSSNSN